MLVKNLVIAALASTVAAKSAVMDLIPSNFDKVVLKSGKPTLVKFYAPWCGHCKKLAPVYEELATGFEANKDKVQIAKVDCDSNKALCKKYGIQGYPTMKFWDGQTAQPSDYSSGRDIDSLTDFITEKTGVQGKKKPEVPTDVQALTDENFGDFVGKKDKNVLVAFTAPWCGHCKNLAPTWDTLATDFVNDDNVVIAKVNADAPNGKKTAKKFGINSYPTIKFFPAGSEEPVAYEGSRSEKDFVSYINEKVGTNRLVGGGLDVAAGTVSALDNIISKLSGSNIAEISKQVSKEADSLKDTAQYKYAEYYVRVFEKLGSSDNYASKELARLDGILIKGGLAPAKRDELQSKVNVLRKFVDQLAGKVKEAKDEL